MKDLELKNQIIDLNKNFLLSKAGLQILGEVDFEDWLQIGNKLKQIEGAVMWWLGDWLNYGEATYGEKYSQALEATEYEYQTLADASYVSSAVHFSRRLENLSFWFHREVASLEPQDQDRFLDLAESQNLTIRELRQQVKDFKKPKLSEINPLPKGIYQTIVADPPWRLDCAEQKSGIYAYQMMDTEEIKALAPEIDQRSAENCHLYLWAINPMLPEAFDVMDAWGFEYKSIITWIKPHFGTGHYFRGQTEHLLFGLRGNLKILVNNAPTFFEAPKGKHSTKPDIAYENIRIWSPGQRLALFERKQRKDFDCWINEPKDDD